jgi:hypothetical protein
LEIPDQGVFKITYFRSMCLELPAPGNCVINYLLQVNVLRISCSGDLGFKLPALGKCGTNYLLQVNVFIITCSM